MANLYEILANAQNGHALDRLAQQYGLTQEQTDAAVSALLPAISKGLKQSTSTPEGLGNLLAVMGQQQYLPAMYDDPDTAFSQQGRAAGNDVLATMFGSPDVSRAFADQAQQFSGVGSSILKKMLPVIAALVVGGLMRGGSGQAAPTGQTTAGQGGGLGDILGQIFGRQMSGSPGPLPPSGQPAPLPGGQPAPTDGGGQPAPGGDLLRQILLELEKGIREGRVKPVIVGPGGIQFPQPGGQAGQAPTNPNAQQQQQQQPQQVPGGDILGQILRDLLGGGAGGQTQAPRPGQSLPQSPGMKELSDLSKQLNLSGGYGSALFGDQFEAGRNVDPRQLNGIDQVFEQFFGGTRR